MRRQVGKPDSFGRSVWLVWPDGLPHAPPVVWIVRGTDPDSMSSVTLAVEREVIPELIEGLREVGCSQEGDSHDGA